MSPRNKPKKTTNCYCKDFATLASIQLALESTDQDRIKCLIEWLSGVGGGGGGNSRDQGNNNNEQPALLSCGSYICVRRGKASLLILNAIRDACRPFLEDSSTSVSPAKKNETTSATPSQNKSTKVITTTPIKQPTYEDAFPSLASSVSQQQTNKPAGNHTTNTTVNNNNQQQKKKQKRRIRPVIVTQHRPAGGSFAAVGNISGLASCDEPLVVPPSAPEGQPQQQQNSISVSSSSLSSMAGTTPQKQDQPRPITTSTATTTTTTTTPLRVSTTFTSTTASINASSPASAAAAVVDNSNNNETKEQVLALPALQNLVELYFTLVDYCLVPSTALELDFLIYILRCCGAQPGAGVNNNMTSSASSSCPAFSSIVCTPLRCHCFAVQVLSKLSRVLRRMGETLVKGLLAWGPFRIHCPDLCKELEAAVIIQEEATTSTAPSLVEVVVPNRQTALLTLPFDKERDSRHNYKTQYEQAMYKNREEVRDAFLYQLRAFLNVRGKVVDAVEANRAIHYIKHSFRGVVDKIKDSNLPWFCEFFCDMLLQIGLVPLEETDIDVLKIANHNTDKLQKLHRRFSSKSLSAPSSALMNNKSTRKLLVADPKNNASSSPATAAQLYFPGHQEFFFHFLMSADSYRLGSHLKVRLACSIKQLASKKVTLREVEKQVMELCLFARFLGVLLFSPNWQSSSNNSGAKNASTPTATTICGLKQLENLGISLTELLKCAWKTKSLVSVVPWVIDLLKLTTWDETTQNAPLYNRLLGLLRQMQLRVRLNDENKGKMAPPGTVLVGLCMETVFGDVVGIANSVFQAKPVFLDLNRSKDQHDILDLDATIVHTPSFLFSCNPHIEQLHDLVARLAREDVLSSMRSPGASRRLRPSAVPATPSPVAELEPTLSNSSPQQASWDAKKPSFFHGNVGKSDPIVQSRLQDAFFHQHPNLKDACEFVAGSAIQVVSARLPSECIRPLLEESMMSQDESNDANRKETIFKSCLPLMKNLLEEIIRPALKTLTVPSLDDKVVDIAVSLTVSHALRSSESMLKNMVTSEAETFLKKLSAQDGKRLFENETTMKEINASKAPDSWLPTLTRSLSELRLAVEQESDHSGVPRLLCAVINELDALPQHGPQIPADGELRSFFQSVLLLDRSSRSVIDWALLSEVVTTDEKWPILSGFIQIAIKVKQLSRHGLRTVDRFVASKESLLLIIELGLRAQETASLAILLVDMVEARLVKVNSLEDLLLKVVRDSPDHSVELATECIALADKQRLSFRFERLASTVNNTAIPNTQAFD